MFVHICMNWSPGWVCQRTSFLWFSGVGALDLGLSELMDAADIASDVVTWAWVTSWVKLGQANPGCFGRKVWQTSSKLENRKFDRRPHGRFPLPGRLAGGQPTRPAWPQDVSDQGRIAGHGPTDSFTIPATGKRQCIAEWQADHGCDVALHPEGVLPKRLCADYTPTENASSCTQPGHPFHVEGV